MLRVRLFIISLISIIFSPLSISSIKTGTDKFESKIKDDALNLHLAKPKNVVKKTLDRQATNLHKVWDEILNQHVVTINNGHSTQVNYAAIKQQPQQLTTYLKTLSSVTQAEFERFSNAKQLAFLINAYNAWTVQLIITNYKSEEHPNLTTIRDLGSFFSSPWKKKFIPLFGKNLSLDNIEHDFIRGSVDQNGKPKYNDPRIHFAVNCASIGCPPIREHAYTESKLEQQLHHQTIRFLSDESSNSIKGNSLNLSSIFKWYEEDFEQGFNGAYSLQNFVLLYRELFDLNNEQKEALKNNKMDVNFLDYNWDLNVLK